MAQQLAHLTSNGAVDVDRATCSPRARSRGPTERSAGSLMELTSAAGEPIKLDDGSMRTLARGRRRGRDTRLVRRSARRRVVDLGEVRGTGRRRGDEEVCTVTYYVTVGDVPKKRHTLHLGPERCAARRRADGRGGFLGRVVAALSPPLAERDQRRSRRSSVKRVGAHGQPAGAPDAPARPSTCPKAATSSPARHPLAASSTLTSVAS